MVALGLVRRAQAELVALAAARRPMGSRRTQAERAEVQAEVARAEAAWRSARALVREVVGEAVEAPEVDGETRRRLRLAATNATWASADAVDRMCHAAGGRRRPRVQPPATGFP